MNVGFYLVEHLLILFLVFTTVFTLTATEPSRQVRPFRGQRIHIVLTSGVEGVVKHHHTVLRIDVREVQGSVVVQNEHTEIATLLEIKYLRDIVEL